MFDHKSKIFYVITKGNFGGAQHYVYDLATNLPQDRFEVKVAFGEGTELGERLTACGIPTIKIAGLGRDVKISSEWQVFWTLYRLFKAERPDIIHLNSSKIGGLGALAGRLARVPKIIFTAHAWAFNEDRPAWQRLLIKIFHWITVWLCDLTIAVSAKTVEQLAHWPGLKNKFCVIHNGLPPVEFLERSEARKELLKIIGASDDTESLEILEQKVMIGTISELHRTKGLDFMIEALAELKNEIPDAIFWIIGQGEEKDHIKKLIRGKDLTEQVLLLGRVPEAKRYLKAFDLFTLTSRTEALPYAVLEAGQAGLPIIASNVGGIPEIIDQGESGILVRPGNIRELKYALIKLANDKKLRAKYGKAITKKVTKEFSIERMVKETITAYK